MEDITAADVLRFDAAIIEGGVCMSNITLNAKGVALSMQDAAIRSDLQLRPNFQSAGYLLLRGIRIEGVLSLSGAKLNTTGKALNLDSATIKWNVFLRDGFQSAGEIRMIGTEIGGQLDCSGATLAAEGIALSLNRSIIHGSVLLRYGFEAAGEIQMLHTQIDGELDFEASAIGLFTGDSMVVQGDLLWRQITISDQTSLDLQGARLKRIRDDEASWPTQGKLRVIGLIVQDLCPLQDHRLQAAVRIAWLKLQPESDLGAPQPWIHLAELFASKGYEKAAEQVRSEFRERHFRAMLKGSKSTLFRTVWYKITLFFRGGASRTLYILLLISLGMVLSRSLGEWGTRFYQRVTHSLSRNSFIGLHFQRTSPPSPTDRDTTSRPVTTITETPNYPTSQSQFIANKEPSNASFLKQPAPKDIETITTSSPKYAPKHHKVLPAKKGVPRHIKKMALLH